MKCPFCEFDDAFAVAMADHLAQAHHSEVIKACIGAVSSESSPQQPDSSTITRRGLAAMIFAASFGGDLTFPYDDREEWSFKKADEWLLVAAEKASK